jgi:aspartyl aminopeptidase
MKVLVPLFFFAEVAKSNGLFAFSAFMVYLCDVKSPQVLTLAFSDSEEAGADSAQGK